MVVVTLNETVATDADLELIGKADGMQTLLVSGIAPQPATRFGMYGPRLPQNPNRLPSQITDDGIRRLGLQPDLSSVSFAHALLTDQALETISSWQQLESLDLQGTKVTSQGIESLKKLGQLKVLNLDGTRVDDDAVQILKKIGSLKKLSVSNTKISGTGLLQLREQLPGCQLVGDYEEISSGVDPDPESMRWKEITRYLWRSGREGKLKLLILTDSGVTDGHLDDLHRLEKTDLIDLRRTQVSEAGVEKLQRMLPDGKLLH
jgi:hypothetical protein